MTISLPVRVVLASGETRGRFRLAVMGVLVVKGHESWLIDDVAAVDEILSTPPAGRTSPGRSAEEVDAQIRIVDPTFLSRLSLEIPPLPPGDFAYFDPAMICGSTRLEGKEVVLDGIWSVFLYREGKDFRAMHRPSTAETIGPI